MCPASRRESSLAKHFHALILRWPSVYDPLLQPCKFTGVKHGSWNINTMQILSCSMSLCVFIGEICNAVAFPCLRVDFARRIFLNTATLCAHRSCFSSSTSTLLSFSFFDLFFSGRTWLFPFVGAPSVKYLSHFRQSAAGRAGKCVIYAIQPPQNSQNTPFGLLI